MVEAVYPRQTVTVQRKFVGRRPASSLLLWDMTSSMRLPALGRARRPLWTDRVALALCLLAIALNGGLALLLWRRFDLLPELIAVHFNAFGEVDLIGSKNEIFKLPLIGAIIWASNAAMAVVAAPYDRVLARAVLGVAVLVQVLFCVAVWRIVS